MSIAAIHPISLRILMLFAFSICLLSLIVPLGSSLSFNFNFSDPNSQKYMTLQPDSFYSTYDHISLTKEENSKTLNGSTGRVTYKESVLLWDEKSGKVTNFTTKFTFIIRNVSISKYIADGFTFFLAPYPAKIPSHTNIAGEYLGLFEDTTAFNESMNQMVAVEFDTYGNPKDPGIGCHVGIDINTINSTSYLFMSEYLNHTINPYNCLFVDSRMTAQIEYNSGQKLLSLLLWSDDDPQTIFNLNATVDISKKLPNKSAIGFSAATGSLIELHQIFSWSFDSDLELEYAPPPSSSSSHKDKSNKNVPIIGGIVAGVFLIFLLAGFMTYCLKQKRSIKNTREREAIDYEFEKGRGPRKFIYTELGDATNDFAKSNKLGEGGFGSVYRGILKGENIPVAVKRVSKDSKQGKKEYISEVKIISQLRHRNLVQLVGWCHDEGELLLVYEFMPNGSLDTHLYSKESPLTWPIRKDVALGLGQALLYLHEECELCVVHRDIKPSNIMLDSSFNAKLGDFGLARVTDHHRDLETTIVAGTKGYMAPECVLGTANASTQSDVFSFGVVLLEMVCGRRPIVPQKDLKKVSLFEWIWNLYGRNTLMEAVDDRLKGDFEKEQVECFMVVGLWCAYPEKSLRPSIRQAMNVLQFQAHLPVLPTKMPLSLSGYATPEFPNMLLSTSSVASSSGVTTISPNSTAAVPVDSSWLDKRN